MNYTRYELINQELKNCKIEKKLFKFKICSCVIQMELEMDLSSYGCITV